MVSSVKRIPFSYQRSDLRNRDSAVETLRGDHIVWWYTGIRSNQRAKTVPLVDVLFKSLVNDVPGAFTPARVPLSNLPHYRIGTIWRDGRCISDTELMQEDFSVDFSPEGWSITSRDQLYDLGLEHTFPDHEYPLKYRRDKAQLLNFSLDGGKRNLLIPCIDFFVRGYASNMDVCRVISTKLYRDVKSCFYDPPLRDERRWIVRPTPKMRYYDRYFLAHLLYDDYTDQRVRRINSQFLSTKPDHVIHPRVEPWFQGPAKLRCRGKWINGGNTFLCLDLCGSSKPEGQDFEWITTKYDSSDGKEGSGRVVMPVSVRTAEVDEFLAEESFSEPDGHAEIMVVKSPPFIGLGQVARKVTKTKEVIQTDKGRLGPLPPKADSHSSGTGHGSGKNIGKSEHVADPQTDDQAQAQSFLTGIWNTFESIKQKNPERVSELSWYTPAKSGTSYPPRIILFNTEYVPNDGHDVMNWIYFSVDSVQRRGMLVLRIAIDNQAYLCFEIQRAEPTEKNPKPPGFFGVLMRCDIADAQELEDFVSNVCIRTKNALGRFKNIRGTFPVVTKIIMHKPDSTELPYRRALISAFKALDVYLD